QLTTRHNTYKEIQEDLEGIPSNLLSERLKSLEVDGLIAAELYQNHPPRYRYVLTESGMDLGDIFNSIILWGEKHLKVCYKQLQHADCGHRVEHQYYCPQCHKVISKEEISVCDPSENEQ
ncbi:MAG: hypothetical protein K0R21_1555, partial [Anaerocolumna sp.]|nr:hypothetical protein [Anaerocolumna sp.]